MKKQFDYRVFPLSLLLALSVAGCGSLSSGVEKVLPDRKVEYKKSKQAERDLEIPPDLTSSSIQDELVIPGAGSSSATLSSYERSRPFSSTASVNRGVLPEVNNIEVVREGDQHWLLIQGSSEDVWFRVAEFWQENGILLEEQDPTVGIMVTGWLENLANGSNFEPELDGKI